MEYMVPPIVLCESGHNICDQCRPKLPICPACRRPFLEARNIALETLAQGLRYPCRNRHLGCPEVYPMALISKHHLMCQHRPYECPLKVPGRCSWKGAANRLNTAIVHGLAPVQERASHANQLCDKVKSVHHMPINSVIQSREYITRQSTL
uniref:RING-type E3 ubiquitin transferase n=1 Tax=Timema shepardi TaxID=629360 RepID=A0A7R9BBN4_TIMSH|nr:unnamed protein product [Timema shepardi]